MYTYYSDGFFGYGPPGTFKPYSLMHFAPLGVCASFIAVSWFARKWLRSWEGEVHLRFVLSFLMIMTEFSYFLRLLYVGDETGNYLMMSKLPLHICDLGLFCCAYMVPSKNRTLFGINFFTTLFGATIACIVPQVILTGVDPSYYRYYQYFGEHLIPIFGTVYMMIVHDMRPRYHDIWVSIAALAAMVLPAFLLNEAYPGSDYMFLKLDLSFLPSDQHARIAVYALFIISMFHLVWFAWKGALRLFDRSGSAAA